MNTAQWTATANADNATATATKAAPNDKSGRERLFVSTIDASFSGSVAGATVIIKDGTTEVWRRYFNDTTTIDFRRPFPISQAAALNVELSASGSGGVIGAVNVSGFTGG